MIKCNYCKTPKFKKPKSLFIHIKEEHPTEWAELLTWVLPEGSLITQVENEGSDKKDG